MPVGGTTINSEEIVNDLRGGMTDHDLMTKYGITHQGLASLLAHLVDSGLMTRDELENRQQLSASQIIRLFLESREESKELA